MRQYKLVEEKMSNGKSYYKIYYRSKYFSRGIEIMNKWIFMDGHSDYDTIKKLYDDYSNPVRIVSTVDLEIGDFV